MVIDFQKFHNRRRQRASYREELVAKILAYHREHPDGEAEDSFYLAHVKNGFPVHVLETILERLEQKASNQ